MKDESKSAFMQRASEISKELSDAIKEEDRDRSYILLISEKSEDGKVTNRATAVGGKGESLAMNVAEFITNPATTAIYNAGAMVVAATELFKK